MSTSILSSNSVSRKRLSLGILPKDALSGEDVHVPLQITLENNPNGKLLRHNTGRYSFSYNAGQSTQLRFRIFDHHRHFVPRRFSAPMLTLTDLLNIETNQASNYLDARVRYPHLFAGAAYPVVSRATGIRGRVVQANNIVRWAVIELFRANDTSQVLARARSDDRGEFLLVLPPSAVPELSIPNSIGATLRVHARPVPLSMSPENIDPHWDIPIETITQTNADDPVSTGSEIPSEYVASQNDLPISLRPSLMSSSAQLGDIVFSPP